MDKDLNDRYLEDWRRLQDWQKTTPERHAQVAANARPMLEGRAAQLTEIAARRPMLAPYLESARNSLNETCRDLTAGRFTEADKAFRQAEKSVESARAVDRNLPHKAAEREIDGAERSAGLSPGERLGMIQKSASRVSDLAQDGEYDRAKGVLKRIIEQAQTLMGELDKVKMPEQSYSR